MTHVLNCLGFGILAFLFTAFAFAIGATIDLKRMNKRRKKPSAREIRCFVDVVANVAIITGCLSGLATFLVLL